MLLSILVTGWYGRHTVRRVIAGLRESRVAAEAPLVLAVMLALAAGTLELTGSSMLDAVVTAPFLLLFHRIARGYAGSRIPDLDSPFRPAVWLVMCVFAAAGCSTLLWFVLKDALPLGAPDSLFFFAWLGISTQGGAPGHVLGAVIAVLAAASPVSLLLASGAAREEAARVSEQRKMRVRDAEVMDRLREVRIVAFDRAGTITEDESQIEEVVVLAAVTQREILETANALAGHLPAAWSAAIKHRCAKEDIVSVPLDEFVAVPGLGAAGSVRGSRLTIGLARLMRESGIDITNAADTLSRCRVHARTALLAARDGLLCGVIVLKAPLKRDSVRAVRALAGMGVRTALVAPEAREDIVVLAEQGGIPIVVGDVLPHDYANAFEQLESETIGRILLVAATEVNESAAADNRLIALLTPGNSPAPKHISVTIERGGVMPIVALLRLASEAFIKTVQNWAIAVVYHAAVIPLAALGLLHPLLAGLLSLAVCFAIGANTSRLRRSAA